MILKLIALSTLIVFVAVPQWFLLSRLNIQEGFQTDGGSATGHLMDEMKLLLYKEGLLEWELLSEQAESFEDGTWKLFEVRGEFQQADNSKIKFVGDRGEVDILNKFVSLEGDVKVDSRDGYIFETDKLNIRSDREKGNLFYSNEKVKIYNLAEDLEIFSKGIKGNTQNGEVELLSEVTCRKSVKQYKDIIIKSDSAYFKSSLKGIRFRENLRITQEKFNIRGREAYFLYDEKTKGLRSVQIDGDILASDGIKTALSNRVEMRTTEDVIIFQGSPRIRVGENEMIGDEILITNQQKNIQVIRGNIKSTKKGIDLDEQ